MNKTGYHFLPKRYHTISFILIILMLIAVMGYLSPVGDRERSVRILIDDCGGKVVFLHVAHYGDYQISCVTCHHDKSGNQTGYVACGLCHPVAFNQQYMENHKSFFADKKACVRCHHVEFIKTDFEHSSHQSYTDDCTDCHHGPNIEPEPRACISCHSTEGREDIPNLRDATHDCCKKCHEDIFDKGFNGCSGCHGKKDMKKGKGAYTPCLYCHQGNKIKQLIPARKDAFHNQCLGCHQELKKGPFGANSCNKCHFK